MAKGGLTKGKSHAEGGIKMKVKSTGQNIEVEGGEVIVNKKNVSDPTKLNFEGEQKTTCEILSDLNSRNDNGVALECDSVEGKKYKHKEGGKLPKEEKKYELRVEDKKGDYRFFNDEQIQFYDNYEDAINDYNLLDISQIDEQKEQFEKLFKVLEETTYINGEYQGQIKIKREEITANRITNNYIDLILNELSIIYNEPIKSFKYIKIDVFDEMDEDEYIGCVQVRVGDHSQNPNNIDRFSDCDKNLSFVISNLDATKEKFNPDSDEFYYNSESSLNFILENIKSKIDNAIEDVMYSFAKGGKVGSKTTYKQKFNKKYGFPKDESHSLSEVSKLTGVSKKGIKQIYEKGEGAFYSNPSSVRKNVKSPQQWAMARVYSSVMGGKASKVDAKELKMEKGGIINNPYAYIKSGFLELEPLIKKDPTPSQYIYVAKKSGEVKGLIKTYESELSREQRLELLKQYRDLAKLFKNSLSEEEINKSYKGDLTEKYAYHFTDIYGFSQFCETPNIQKLSLTTNPYFGEEEVGQVKDFRGMGVNKKTLYFSDLPIKIVFDLQKLKATQELIKGSSDEGTYLGEYEVIWRNKKPSFDFFNFVSWVEVKKEFKQEFLKFDFDVFINDKEREFTIKEFLKLKNISLKDWENKDVKEYLFGGSKPKYEKGGILNNPNFKEWFGDSKVVDENGNPLVVYHGTDENFDEFLYGIELAKKQGELGQYSGYSNQFGVHFGTKKASNYFSKNDGSILPVYLKIENPLRVPDLGEWDSYRIFAYLIKGLGWEHLRGLDEEDYYKMGVLKDVLKSKGYDGFVYVNNLEGGGTDSYIVLEPTQIKSAIGNSGEYDPNNPSIIMEKGGTINDLPFYQKQENELLDLIKEKIAKRYEFWDSARKSDDYKIEDDFNNKARGLSGELKYLEPKAEVLKNITYCLSNGGSLVNFTDKIGFEHKDICDFRGISTDNFDFSEEDILDLPQPKYIPYFDESALQRKGFVVEAIKYTDDSYIVSVNAYREEKLKQGILQLVILNLDQLALTLDYYYLKAKAKNKAEAERQNKRNEEYFLNKSKEYRAGYYNQRNFYFSLPSKLKKTIGQEEWEGLSIEEKQELYLPVKKYKGKRLTSKLYNNEMYVSFKEMYLRFVDKSKTSDKYNAHPDIFKYYFKFRDAMKFKTIDIRIQRTALSETYQKGMETSYGRSGVDKRLYNLFGIVVKRQNGERISVMDFDQIKEGWMDCVKVFGNLKPLSDKYQMVVSHSSRKYQFANKRAIGIFIPTIPAIGVSSKFGEVQFKTTMAHEVAHFLDYCVGQIRGLRYSTDDFDSTSGKLVKLFRDNMNLASSEQNDYINSSKECFARAFEQYFSYKLYGFNGKVEYSEGQVEDDNYFENDNYVSRGMWRLIEPLIEKFLDENKDVLEFTVDLDQTDEKEPIGVEEEIKFLEQKKENKQIKKELEMVEETKSESKETHSTNSKLDMLYRVLKSKYENQGMSLKQIYDEVINMQGIKDGALIFSEFVKRKKEEGDKRFIDEFNKTSFVENIHSKTKPSSIKQQLEKALKGIQVAIDIAGETKELLKAKKGIEIAINLISKPKDDLGFIGIYLYENSPSLNHYDIVKETEKAYQIENQKGKKMFIPKSALKLSKYSYGENKSYEVKKWFRQKLENWQLSFLQSEQ